MYCTHPSSEALQLIALQPRRLDGVVMRPPSPFPLMPKSFISISFVQESSPELSERGLNFPIPRKIESTRGALRIELQALKYSSCYVHLSPSESIPFLSQWETDSETGCKSNNNNLLIYSLILGSSPFQLNFSLAWHFNTLQISPHPLILFHHTMYIYYPPIKCPQIHILAFFDGLSHIQSHPIYITSLFHL